MDNATPMPGITITSGELGNRVSNQAGQFCYNTVAAGLSFVIKPFSRLHSFDPPIASGSADRDYAMTFERTEQVLFGGVLERVSVSSSGREGDADSGESIAADRSAKIIAFSSLSTSLTTPPARNPVMNVFVRNTSTGLTMLVSDSDLGDEAHGPSGMASPTGPGVALSADGRTVAFATDATNLFPGLADTNGARDIIVYQVDRDMRLLGSRAHNGDRGDGASYDPALSGDGSMLAFASDARNLVIVDDNGMTDVFVRNLSSEQTIRISEPVAGGEANGRSYGPVLSEDGTLVAFVSEASNLVPDDTNGVADVFVRDIPRGTLTRVSVSATGSQSDGASVGARLSGNGQVVVFASDATNLVGGDTNQVRDVFVKTLATGAVTRASVSSSGVQATRASGNGMLAISGNGRFVVFPSTDARLAPGDTEQSSDLLVHDVLLARTGLLSRDTNDISAGSAAFMPVLSFDGSEAVYATGASSLIPGDKNKKVDVYRTVVQPLPAVITTTAPTVERAPTVVKRRKQVTIVLQRFILGFDTKKMVALGSVSASNASRESREISYTVEIRQRSSNSVRRVVSKRNVISLRNMPPGSYSIRYQVAVNRRQTEISRSPFSPRTVLRVS